MKRTIAGILLVTLMVCFSGCSDHNENVQIDGTSAFTEDEKIHKEDAAIDNDEAPTLSVILGEKVLKVEGTVSDYEKKNSDGTETVINATLIHPLLAEYDPIYTDVQSAEFSFEEQPNSVSLKVYKGEDLGTNIYDAQSAYIEPVGKKWPLQKGENIYALTASWKNNVSSRTAQYYFYIVLEE